jgi:hypothetical protein
MISQISRSSSRRYENSFLHVVTKGMANIKEKKGLPTICENLQWYMYSALSPQILDLIAHFLHCAEEFSTIRLESLMKLWYKTPQ